MGAAAKSAAVSEVKFFKDSGKDLQHRLNTRASKELIVAFAGPIGCGLKSVIDDAAATLKDFGYEHVVTIKLSKLLEDCINDGSLEIDLSTAGCSPRFVRYRRLQEAGRVLRQKAMNSAVLAEYAMREVGLDRTERGGSAAKNTDQTVIPGKVAYLIDQVKRPEEVELLRAVYRNSFVLIGVTRTAEKRRVALMGEGISEPEAQQLIDIDRQEVSDAGQRIDKTLHLSDYFLRNDHQTVEERKAKMSRFIQLLHGKSSVSPTNIERGMFAAHAAGLRSACLSRQVGAAIAGPGGEIIATGCNDVPSPDGGLYGDGGKAADMRCIHREEQYCFNDFYKRQLRDDIGQEFRDFLNKKRAAAANAAIEESEIEELINLLYKNTRLKDLIEFSRSVHAEMDAIVSMGRNGGMGLLGSTLFTTTFPCHSCARHIVAAGIRYVYYIEPYDKIMARQLHGDAIAFDADPNEAQNKKVQFLHYEGVAPRQFSSFFAASNRKDDNGKVVEYQPRDALKTTPEYLDNYQTFEAKAAEHFELELAKIKGKQ